MFRSIAAAALLLGSLTWAPAAEACSCLPPTVQSSYRNADHVFSGRVLSETIVGQQVVYRVRVTRDGKSCLPTGRVIEVVTPVSGATCGTRFQTGPQYLFFAYDVPSWTGPGVRVSTNSCAGNMRVRDLARDEIDWLRTRYVPCANSCLDANVPVLNCLVDPCTQVPACQRDATCEANYCGGCTAEFYDSNNYQVCVP